MVPADDVHAMLLNIAMRPGQPIEARLYEALRLMCKYRAEGVAAKLLQGLEPRVQTGPFAGMAFLPAAAEGSYLPKLLGQYELELWPIITGKLTERGYQQVINVGCAEGYYAVGLARLLEVVVHAVDIDAAACAACRALAEKNGVAERVTIASEELTAADFERFAHRPTLVLCDIEGAEDKLLDPVKAPPLTGMDLLVEVHDVFVPGTGERLVERFEPSHDIEVIPMGTSAYEPLAQLRGLEQIDQLLARWEWRLADAGWLWLEAKKLAS